MLVPGYIHGPSHPCPLCGSQHKAALWSRDAFVEGVAGKAHDTPSPGRRAAKAAAGARENFSASTSYLCVCITEGPNPPPCYGWQNKLLQL